ncbi:MAG: 3'-5' exoribonuclease YhaM family protein [Solirubrobacterales bacterium]
MSEQTTISANGASEAADGRQSIRDLADGERVDSIFAVRDRDLAKKRDGEDYLRLKLGDSSGNLAAICWDDPLRCFEIATPGAVLRVAGRYSVSPQYGPQLKIDSLATASEGEYDPRQLGAAPERSVELLEADLRQLIETVQNPQLRELLDRFFGAGTPAWERFRAAPAAKLYHQAYPGGLLDHTLSVAQAVSAAASYFPGIDRDVAVTGALLHDIGKTEAYNDDPLAIDLTDAGRLQGEIPLGYYKVRSEIESIEGFDPSLAEAVVHIILSHHGTLEHGSPVVPATREAALVHALDNLGGKLGSFDRLERELPDGESWSRFDRGISGAAFFGSRAA